jgi:hypothetical protein
METTRKRRWQFGLRSLLLLPAIFAVGWWLATWPDRTMSEFTRLLNEGRFEEAAELVDEGLGNSVEPDDGCLWIMHPGEMATVVGIAGLDAEPATVSDWITCKRVGLVQANFRPSRDGLSIYVFTAAWGRVSVDGPQSEYILRWESTHDGSGL